MAQPVDPQQVQKNLGDSHQDLQDFVAAADRVLTQGSTEAPPAPRREQPTT